MSHKIHPSRIPSVLFSFLLILVGALSTSTPGTAAAGSLETAAVNTLEFQLVSAGRGWVLMGQQLYWTGDSGLTWRDITPPAGSEIMDVFFLDDQNARAVLNPNDSSRFVLAGTSDGGGSWNSMAYDFSELSQMPSAVTEVYMGWRDPLNGWLVFKFATGSNFSLGLLYMTGDGGSTWKVHDIPLGEPAYFSDAQNGWVAGGPAGRLFQTQDGGGSWQEQTLAAAGHYQLPVFVDEVRAFLPVVTMDEELPVAGFFQTADAGQTWTLAGRVTLGLDTASDVSLPFSVSDEGNGTLIVPNSDRLVSLVEGELSEYQNEDGFSSGLVAIDMVSPQAGWGKWMAGICDTAEKTTGSLNCSRETRLLATGDGGAHWESIPLPGTGQASIQERFSQAGRTGDESMLGRLALADPDSEAYLGQGFDKCEIASLSQLQNWWTNSPYNAVNLYIGGSARGCSNAALSASFLSQANAQGWRFIPTWVGPQANCTGYLSRMSSDPAVAYNQGVAEANLALNTAVNLGLSEPDGSGTIIYYDLEAYGTSNVACRNAANSFISGWVAQLRARGSLAGVYGASCASAVTDWASIANVPDAIWIANWYGNAGTVSYRPTASVWSTACLSDGLWADHKRLRQYAGGHNETWGGITLNIDSNVLDGPLTVRNGTGGRSAPSLPLNLGPAQGSILSRANDTWLTWKTTGDTCSVHVWGGSLDTTISGNCSLYRLGVRPGGSYSWQVTSRNDYGSTLGPVWQFKIKPYSPANLAVTSVSSTKANLSWQLSADEPANVDGYNVYKDGVKIGSVGKGVASYQAAGLACNSPHSFHVKTVRQSVESDASNSVSATTTTCLPALLSPAEGLVLPNRRPLFEWGAVDEATSYQIQVSIYATFASPAINTSLPATSYLPTADLLTNRQYYWRVRGIGPFGYGDWSATGTFKTANPPSLPAISSPANGGLTTTYRPKLNWTDAALPYGTQLDHYQVQIASDSAFSTKLYDESTTVSEFLVPADLSPNAKYYWHVQAFNTLGQYSSWTATWSFRTLVLPPLLNSPSDGFALDHRTPALEWGDVDGATRYMVQISRYANFSTVLVVKFASLSQYAFISDLPRNTLLYWRVRAEAVNGPSQWSNVWKFQTGNSPGIPALLSPASNALITNYQPRLDWANVTIPVLTSLDHYHIQIATDSGFGAIFLDRNAASSEFIPDIPLNPNVKYYWRVRAYNTAGHYSSWSAVWYFRTAMLPPQLGTPENNASSPSLRPVFNWQITYGATSYLIQVSRYSTFSTNLVSAQVLSPTYTPAINLPRGVVLYWRVRANGANGPSLWSPVFQFTIQ